MDASNPTEAGDKEDGADEEEDLEEYPREYDEIENGGAHCPT